MPFRARLDPMGLSRLTFRVWPLDLDLNGHMTNSRYLALMDLGRLDLVGRSSLRSPVIRFRWRPVVGSSAIRFRRGLKPFRRFELHTHVVGWDEKWIFLEQRFVQRGELVAVGLVKACFRRSGGGIPTREVTEACGLEGPSPVLPEYVHYWMASEAALRSPIGSKKAEREGLVEPAGWRD